MKIYFCQRKPSDLNWRRAENSHHVVCRLSKAKLHLPLATPSFPTKPRLEFACSSGKGEQTVSKRSGLHRPHYGLDYQNCVHFLKLLGFFCVPGSFFTRRLSCALNSRAAAWSAGRKSASVFPDSRSPHLPLPAVPFCFHLKATLRRICL